MAALSPGRKSNLLSTGKSVFSTRSPAARLALRDHLGQPVIGLRAEHHVHEGRAGHDLLALGLGDAAGDGDDHAAAVFLGGLTVFLDAQAAKLGKDLLRRLLADVAGVQDDHIGPVGGLDRLIAQRRQDIGHTGAVIDIHLAAPGLDEQFLLGQMLNPDARVDPRDALMRKCI